MSQPPGQQPDAERPVLRIVAGGIPSDEETAALAAVLTLVAASTGPEQAQPSGGGRWRDSARRGAPWTRTGWLASARGSALRGPQ